MRFIAVFLILLFVEAYCAEFGQYNYSNYIGLQQQLSANRARAIRNQMRYNQSPTRNILYPTSNNPYPNINTTPSRALTRRQRYSRDYYNSL